MQSVTLSREEVARLGKALYAEHIRSQVETDDNIGKMVIIDIETGDFEVDELGLDSAEKLHARHPHARLYGLKIGYNVAESLGGIMERTAA
ncbi:hypothetical protein [Armatimonas sp.]|uniref:hypothetical protein n=1 Tax=Armatimonas sp. TaxID=1872638 RepID=UPI0037513B8F